MKIALISCSKLKTDRPCPARELYAPSRLFSLSYQYARRNADKVYILSAKYGLVEESAVIAPYDLTLADLPEYRQRDWANYVLTQMGERFDLERDTFLILAGRRYYQHLLPHLPHAILPLGNLSIGERIAFLQQQLADSAPCDDAVSRCLRLHQHLTALPDIPGRRSMRCPSGMGFIWSLRRGRLTVGCPALCGWVPIHPPTACARD